MKLFIVSIEDIFDYVSNHHVPYLAKTKEEAKRYLKEKTETAIEQTPDWVQELGEDYSELYLDGEYSCNHWSAQIDEVEFDLT